MENEQDTYKTVEIDGKQLTFTWEDPSQLEDKSLQEMREMFADSFLLQYRTHNSKTDLSDAEIKEGSTSYFIDSIEQRFKSNDKHHFLSLRSSKKVLGFILWEDLGENQAYVAEFAIASDYWRQGLGKIFMGSIFSKLPNTKKIVLITEKENPGAQKFYEALGYKSSTYMHEGYSAERFCAYEFEVN